MNKKKFPRRTAFVYCSGGAEKTFEYEGVSDCREALEKNPQGNLTCSYGCLGLGSCVKACKKDAIHINAQGVAEVDEEKCINCGLCRKACPRGLIRPRIADSPFVPRCSNQDKGAAAKKVCTSSCIACGLCVKNCPCEAVAVMDNHAVIADEDCLSCGNCVLKCPRNVIADVRGLIHK